MGKKKNTSDEARISPLFLEHVKMSSFGKFSNIIVGPFSPGLNVVYGPNEAGKTTLNELVKGVLFGWPSSRGQGNSLRNFLEAPVTPRFTVKNVHPSQR